MNVSLAWLFFLFILVLAVGVFLWPSMRRRLAAKKEIQAPLRTAFQEETSEELGIPVRDPAPRPAAAPPEPQLPRQYGVDRLVLMARDPHWLYAYWEITATKQGEFASIYGADAWRRSHSVLRVYDVTGVDFNGANANRYLDIPVDDQLDSWHIQVEEPDRSFCVDMGRMFPDGRFVTLLRSNIVTTPRASLSDRLDEEWMWIEGLYRSIGKFQYGVSSPLIVEELALQAGALPLGISSPGTQRENAGPRVSSLF